MIAAEFCIILPSCLLFFTNSYFLFIGCSIYGYASSVSFFVIKVIIDAYLFGLSRRLPVWVLVYTYGHDM